jgi:hypothetical protein
MKKQAGYFVALLVSAVMYCGASQAVMATINIDTVYSNSFETSAGEEWSSATRDTTPSGRHFLGQFVNNTHLSLTLGTGSPVFPEGLAPHDMASISFNLFIIYSWDGALNGDKWSLAVGV